ncbi:hypothetical protein PV325_012272 [Microctonus aethiopoides]|nr:hypothetical protein PV325_012272 [Microctonus aethiopoides]
MGYLKSFGTTFIWVSTVLVAITHIPGLPPHVEFTPYEFKPPAAIEHQSNGRLNGAEKLFDGEIKGPEYFDSYDGVLYTTLHLGTVSKLVGNKLVEVVKFGKKCDGMWEEEKCGRPLGLKFDKQGRLYVVDAYYGVFKVDVETGKYEKIIDISVPIEGKVAMLPNSIDVASNGDLFWTVSSNDFQLKDGMFSMLTDPTGRLIRYDAATKRNVVLLENLGFANGIKLSDDESFVLVAESLKLRIVKYHLKGPKAGSSEILIEGLPGVPDNIHSDGQGNFLVSLYVLADEEHPLLSQSLAPHSNIRKLIVRAMTLLEAPFKLLDQVYPNYYSKQIVHSIGHFESSAGLFHEGVVVLRIDPTGKVIDVLDETDGKLSRISSAFPLGDYLYLGSPFNQYLARVPLDTALPGLKKAFKSEPQVVKQIPTPKIEEKPIPKPAEIRTTTEKPLPPPPPPPTTTTAPPPPATVSSPPQVQAPSPTTTPPPPPVQAPKIIIEPVDIPVEVPVVPKPTKIPQVNVPVQKPQAIPQQKKHVVKDEM